ncbi:MAG: hypothetical protein GX896_07595, partial [Clostridiales bacterium]|nr:hypothetical protein [Clostridiales bacterium]
YMNSITVSNTIVDTQQVSTYKFNTDYDVKGATMDIVTRTVYSDWTDIASAVVPTTVIKYDGKEIYPHQLLTPENSSQDMTIKATTKIPAPTYTVTIPASIDIGSVSGALEKYRNADTDKAGEKIVVEKPFTVYASGVENLFDGKKLFVSIGTADVETTMTGSDSTITCKLNKDGTSYTEGTEFASFVNDLDLAVGEQNIQKGSVLVNRCDIKTTADYTGTLTFNIEIKEGN